MLKKPVYYTADLCTPSGEEKGDILKGNDVGTLLVISEALVLFLIEMA
jgi:hypothetical protein